jgi:hypothetical protein
MPNFAQDIQNFQRYGTYIYKFDNVGNMIFNSSSADFSQVYVSFPLQNVFYDNSKITSFYDPTFNEVQLTPAPILQDAAAIQRQLDTIQIENASLKSQLDTIINSAIISDTSGSIAVTKRLILNLREALGEGQIDTDFSETFPYLPLVKATS